MVQQGVDQGPVAVAGGRVDDQPGGLVDDQQMLVLENDSSGMSCGSLWAGSGSGTVRRSLLVAADLARRVADRDAAASTAPLRIRSLMRSRDRVGTAAASARSSRQPAWVGVRRTSIV